jgi:hypothetical protein
VRSPVLGGLGSSPVNKSGHGLWPSTPPPQLESEFVYVISCVPLTGTPTAWGVRWPAMPLAGNVIDP